MKTFRASLWIRRSNFDDGHGSLWTTEGNWQIVVRLKAEGEYGGERRGEEI